MSARDRLVASGLAIFVLATTAVLMARGVRLAEEDGFYYFKIAQNAASGLGPTFDGLHPTSGYHPLWLLCLVALFRALPASGDALAAATLMQAALAAAAAALAYRLARASAAPAAAAAGALVWLALTLPVALSGVEFALQAAVLHAAACVYRFRWRDGRPASGRAALGMGALLALAVLARIDNVLLAALICLAAARALRGAEMARLSVVALPPALALAATLAANFALVGSALPVSAVAKRAWSAHLLSEDPLYGSGGWVTAKAWNLVRPAASLPSPGAMSIVTGGWLAGALWLARSFPVAGGLAGALRPLGPFVLFAALQPLVYGIAYHGHYSYAPWYWAVQPLLAALLAAAAFDRLLARGPRALAVAACGAALLAPLAAVRAHAWRPALEGPLYVAAAWARENLPPSARAASWNAGAIAFLSGRQVVNLDGVANTPRFFAEEQYDLCSYWDRNGITHLVDVFDAREGSASMKGATFPVWRFYERCASRLEPVWSQPMPGNPGWPKAFRLRPVPVARP